MLVEGQPPVPGLQRESDPGDKTPIDRGSLPYYETYEARPPNVFRDRREEKASARQKYEANLAKKKRVTLGSPNRQPVQAQTPLHQHSVITVKKATPLRGKRI